MTLKNAAFAFCVLLLLPANAKAQSISGRLPLDVSMVALGETGHGYASLNRAKSTVALQMRKAEFRRLLFESSFTGSIVAWIEARDSTCKRADRFLYPFWITPDVLCVIDSFAGTSETVSPTVLGFDVQEDCRFGQLADCLKKHGWIKHSGPQLDFCDSILNRYIGVSPQTKETLDGRLVPLLVNGYIAVHDELGYTVTDLAKRRLLQRALINRIQLCYYLELRRPAERMHFRDSLMADNILWLREHVFGNDRIVLWAADSHVAMDAGWMGGRLAARLGGQYVAVALGHGKRGIPLQDAAGLFLDGAPGPRFRYRINAGEKEKIGAAEWITPCD